MMLTEYLVALRNRLWLIIILPLVAAGAAFSYSIYLMKPIYEANTTFYINNSMTRQSASINTDDMVARQYLVKDYIEIIKSRAVILSVIEELELTLSADELEQDVTVASKDNTSLLEIKVKNQDPGLSAEIANKIGSVFIQKTTELIGINKISIVDAAVIPTIPASPSAAVNACLAFFTAMIAAMFAAFLAEYTDNKIKTEKDVEKYLKLKLLGIIPAIKAVR